MQYISGRRVSQDFGVPGITTNDTVINVDGRIAAGIGTSATASVDAASIRFRGDLIDTDGLTGEIGYFLTKDAGGLVWSAVNPTNENSVFVSQNGSQVGVSSYIGFNFKSDGGELVAISTNTGNPAIADIEILSRWNRDANTGIYTSKNIGIGSATPNVALDVVGDGNFTGIVTANKFAGNSASVTNLNVSGVSTFVGISTFSKIGIGLDNPTSELEIIGGAKVSGILTAGSLDVTGSFNVASATTATNLANGLTGQISYQTQPGITGFLTTGTTNQVLTSQGPGLEPIWAAASGIGTEGSVNTSGIITATGGFIGNLTGTATTATSLNGVVEADLNVASATTATNLANGVAGQISYQTAPGTTGFLTTGINGYVLRSQGAGLAPTWQPQGAGSAIEGITIVDEGSIVGTAGSITNVNFVGNGVVATATAGGNIATVTFSIPDVDGTNGIASTATDLAAGAAGSIPYQDAPSSTVFLSAPGQTDQVLLYDDGSNAPQWSKVGLGTNTVGDYVKSATTGNAQQISVTGAGEGADVQISIANNPTLPGNVTIGNDLNVTGNVFIGGTSASLDVNEFKVKDKNVIAGFTTNTDGNEVSSDTTANGGGISIASTVGNPLVDLSVVGIDTLSTYYKRLHWYEENAFAGLGTDAWLSNYAVGIGSTQFPTGTRLAAGNVQITENDLTVVRNINASGIVTGEFVGNLTGTASTASFATTAFTLNGVVEADLNVASATTATNLANGVAGQISYQTAPGTTGFLTTGINGYVLRSQGAGLAPTWQPQGAGSAIEGITIVDEGSIVGTAGSITNVNFVGNGVVATATAGGNIATVTFNIPDADGNTGIASTARDVIGGIGSITSLTVSGVTTSSGGFVGNLTGTASTASFATTAFTLNNKVEADLNVATAVTATNLSDAANITTGTISSDRLTGSYSIDITGNAGTASTASFATTAFTLNNKVEADLNVATAVTATNVIGGIGSITSLTVSGISTFQSNVNFNDAVRAYFGNDEDLSIVHLANNNWIQSNTGNFNIHQNADDSDITFRSDDGSGGITEYINIDGSTGEVVLYHYGSQKLATKSGGIDVTGLTDTDDLIVSGVSTFTGVADFNGNVDIDGHTELDDVNVSGAITATTFTGDLTGNAGTATTLATARDFSITGDFVTAPVISFNGSADVAFAATITENSIGLGTYTTGDYVKTVAGTANEIQVTSGTGEGSTPTIGFVANPTIGGNVNIGQDLTVARDLQVTRNLNVDGNVTIGGTSATIFAQTLKVSDSDLILGVRTDASGTDISNDTTANHGGIAIASTEGDPLITLVNPGAGETLPSTYKKIMWFKTSSFTGLSTDAWLSNYAFGVGTTSMSAGTKFAVGNIETDFDDITNVRNINATGITTSSGGFVGNLTGNAGTATTATNLADAANITTGTISSDRLTGSYDIDITGTATTATNLSNAANITTGTISSDRLTGSYDIDISGNAGTATTAGIATYTSEWILESGNGSDYGISGPGLTGTENDPTFYLTRGEKYKFTNNTGGHPFRIQSTPNGSAGTQYNDGITNNDAGNGTTLLWNVQFDSPDILYYQCTTGGHGAMGGKIYIVNAGIASDVSVNTTGIITASSFSGDGSNLSNTGSTLSEPSSGTQRIVTTSLTTGKMTSSGTGAELAFDYANNHLEFSDSTKATFGTDNDLEIFHNGSNSLIQHTGTGNLFITNSSDDKAVFIQSDDGSGGITNYFIADGSTGEVLLGHYGVQKLATKSNGIDVTGHTETDTLNVSGVSTLGTVKISSGIVTATSGVVTYYGDGSQLSGIGIEPTENTTNQAQFVPFFTGTATTSIAGISTTKFVFNPSTTRMGIGTDTPGSTLEINVGTATSALDIQGSQGQLFSVTNNLTSGSIFSVNDVSGIPSIDVDANGTIQLAPFGATEFVGVGTTNPTSKLHVVGDTFITGVVTATDFNSTSDARLKTNVQVIDDPLDKIVRIDGVSFNWIKDNKPSMGVIADNIQEVLPELVSGSDPKTVNYNGLIGLLIEVVKNQQTQIDSLNDRLSKLE